MSFPTPGGDLTGTYDRRPLRYDLDDLNGEICLLDWGEDGHPEVSLPNRHLPSFKLMKDGCINLVTVYEGKDESEVGPLHHRMTLLDPQDHEFMKALPKTKAAITIAKPKIRAVRLFFIIVFFFIF